jgi:cytochrome P450
MLYKFPPGPKGLPFFGKTFEFRRDPLTFFTRLSQDYGPIASINVPRGHVVLASHASAVKQVLIENSHNFSNREAYSSLTFLLGDGLLTIDGEIHKQQRRLVMPAFHKGRIENYASIMVQDTLSVLENWQPGKHVDIASEMQWLTLQIVAKALFNVDLSQQTNDLGQAFVATAVYINQIRSFSPGSLRINLPFTPYGRFKKGKELLDQTVYHIIDHHRHSDQDYGDVLSMLLRAQDDQGKTLSDIQVHDQTLTFLAAGHATTASTLGWTFYQLSQNPQVRQKLLEEIWRVLGHDRPPNVEDLEQMPYLEMVVKESMRLFPPAWALLRYAREDFDLEGYHLPAGTFVGLSHYVTHRLPIYWTNPESFWPERFSAAHHEPKEAFAYFPFGAGPRTCIGMPFAMMEARLLLATILQRFTPELAPEANVKPQPLITLIPQYGLPMILHKSELPVQMERQSQVVEYPL